MVATVIMTGFEKKVPLQRLRNFGYWGIELDETLSYSFQHSLDSERTLHERSKRLISAADLNSNTNAEY